MSDALNTIVYGMPLNSRARIAMPSMKPSDNTISGMDWPTSSDMVGEHDHVNGSVHSLMVCKRSSNGATAKIKSTYPDSRSFRSLGALSQTNWIRPNSCADTQR